MFIDRFRKINQNIERKKIEDGNQDILFVMLCLSKAALDPEWFNL